MFRKIKLKSCGRYPLHTGAKFVSWLYTIIIVKLAVLFLAGLTGYYHFPKEYGPPTTSTTNDTEEPSEKGIFAVLFGASLFVLFLCTLLLIGVYKRKCWLMIPFLIITAIGYSGYTGGAVYYLIASFSNFSMIRWFVQYSVAACVLLYIWLVIYSFFRELKDEANTSDLTVFNRF